MKFLIFFALVTLCQSIPDTTDTAKHFCQMSNLCDKGTQSVACLYTKSTNSQCGGTILPFNKELVVRKHNEHRQAIASGEFQPQYKTAASMYELSYSDELAQMALYNVKKCDFEHDDCLNTNNFKNSGQNLAQSNMTLGTFDVSEIDEFTSEFIDDWFSEYEFSNMDEVNSLPDDTNETGHFLQLIQENCKHVGCAFISYIENGEDNVLFACNYGYGNLLSATVYTVGAPGSKCKSRSKSFKALCSSQ